ncbi:MAG: type II secretion system protein GspD [Alphaproteobacteria bacterium]|nr:type II secretion system protein GspD [Alphaproteobacteria bacterium]
MPFRNSWQRAAFVLLCLTLTSCAELQEVFDEQPSAETDEATAVANAPAQTTAPVATSTAGDAPAPPVNEVVAAPKRTPQIDLGTGTFINERPISSAPLTVTNGGEIVLSFANANVRDVARVVMSEVLELNYSVHPQIDGSITLQTSRPLSRAAVLPAFENVLQMIGAAIVPVDNLYKIVPAQEAPRQAQRIRIGNERLPRGSQYAIQIVPLEFVSAREIQRILEPVVTQGSIVRVDTSRNLLVLAGPGREMQTWLSLIDTFDVDWLAGMSFGLFPLEFTDASSVVGDLETIVGAANDEPLEGILRFVPLERLNAVLVISPQPRYIARAEKWIQKLDESTDEAGRRLFVYYIQNGNAADLAQVLGDIFSATASRDRPGQPSVAPNLRPVVVRAPATQNDNDTPPQNNTPAQQTAGGTTNPATNINADGTSLVFEGEQEVRIIADEGNNALVVLATPSDFRMVEAALTKLDIPPLQVLVEATIAEVELNETLQYGVQWFFKNGRSTFSLSQFATGTADSIFPGFSYVLNATDIRVVLNALDEVTDLNVVSSPQLMVLDNRTARLQVGDQVPVVTQQAQSVTQEGTPLVNSVEQRDTGVILSVTPRVNAGGLVIMDIEQEVSDVVATTTSGIDSPTIRTRKIASSIAVQSGETVALGGLIRDRTFDTNVGIPALHKIPVLGALFGRTEETVLRTELLVLLTPRVAGSQGDARAITDELRRRMRDLDPLIDRVAGGRPTATSQQISVPATVASTPQSTSDAPSSPNLELAPPPPRLAAAPRLPVDASAPESAPGTLKVRPAIVERATWRIQLAALDNRKDTQATWAAMQQANQDLLDGLTLHVQQANLAKGTFYRLQAGPLADVAAATGLCKSLKSRNQNCLVVAP